MYLHALGRVDLPITKSVSKFPAILQQSDTSILSLIRLPLHNHYPLEQVSYH